jgi:hypothetical protein
MNRNRKAATARRRKSLCGSKSQSLSDPQFEERLRIARQLVHALREAGYSCECEQIDDARPALQREH